MVKSQEKPANTERTDGHYPTRRWIAAMRTQGWPEERIENVVETAAEPETLMTLAEAAEEFGIALATLQTWVHRGRLVPRAEERFHAPGGRRYRVDRDDVAYLKANPPQTGRPRQVQRIENVVETAAEPETLMTLAEAAEEFGIALATLQTWVHRGRLVPRAEERFPAPGGRRYRVDRDDVAYLKANPPQTGRPRQVQELDKSAIMA